MPSPFLVMATQNPIETEGTYPLPEAQVDRFMMKVLVGYPSEEEEVVIVNRVTGPRIAVSPVATPEQLAALQEECRKVYVDPELIQYAVRVVPATRKPAACGLDDMARYMYLRRQPARHHRPDRGRARLALLRGRALRAAGRHDRPRARRAAPSPGAVVRGAVRRRDAPTSSSAASSRPCRRPSARWKPMFGWRRANRGREPAAQAPPRPPPTTAVPAAGPRRCCAGWNGRSSAAWTACCRATTARCCAASAWTSPTCASTSRGDDVRHIDWNVTARLQAPHVREFQEDREISAWFLLDLSGSVDFGSGGVRKRALLDEFTAVHGAPAHAPWQPGRRGALRRRGRRGAARGAGARGAAAPAAPDRPHERDAAHPRFRRTSAAERRRAPRLLAKPGCATCWSGRWPSSAGARCCSWCPTSSARRAGSARSPCWRVATRWWRFGWSIRWRRRCPTSASVVLQDAETGEQMFVDTHDAAFRKRFAEAAATREAELQGAFARAGVECLSLTTDARLDLALLQFARRRAGMPAGERRPHGGQLPALSFLWPRMLWLLACLPVLAWLYAWQDVRRRRAAARYPALRVTGLAPRGGAGWRRHLPAILVLLGLAALVVAVARPQAVLLLPSRIETVILAVDMSGSMKADDVKPSRIRAAQRDGQGLPGRAAGRRERGPGRGGGHRRRGAGPPVARTRWLPPSTASSRSAARPWATASSSRSRPLLPQAVIDAERFMRYRQRQAPREARPDGRPRRPSRPPSRAARRAGRARLLRHGRHRAVFRRRGQRRPRRAPGSPASPPSTACASTPWASARRKGWCCRWTAGRPARQAG